jgi:hypothetical protein
MQCKCGGTTRSSSHEVKTESGKAEWGVTCEGKATIEQDKCESCGRMMVKIWNDNGVKIYERG